MGKDVPVGIYPIKEALRLAKQKAQELGEAVDLVEIAQKDGMPICKIIDYAKYRYERNKKKKLQEKANKVVLKRLRLTPNIDPNALEFKKRHAIKFLQSKASIEVSILFRGFRDFVHMDKAKENLAGFVAALEAHGGKIKQEIKLKNRKMSAIIDPGKSINKS